MSGRLQPRVPSIVGALLVFSGFVATFTPQFLLGNAGMPRRYHTYPPQYQILHVISTVGSWAIAGGLMLVLVTLLYSLRRGRSAPPNPWGALGLEWTTPSPPPVHNFDEPPAVTAEPYEYWRVRE
jgi:cytochrome c oxidase subunit 1